MAIGSANDSITFASVYKGPNTNFKVTKLQESTLHLFRICALNETGQGKWSDVCKFSTVKAPPIISKSKPMFPLKNPKSFRPRF